MDQEYAILKMRYIGALNLLGRVASFVPRDDGAMRFPIEQALKDGVKLFPELEYGRASNGGYFFEPKREPHPKSKS